MKYTSFLQIVGVSCSIDSLANAFNSFPAGIPFHKTSASPVSRRWQLSQSTIGDSERPELVAQSTFVAATETLYREVAKAQGAEYVSQDGEGTEYAIGRILIDLSIPPQIDLVETPELVLVNGVSEGAQDQGIRPLDTIVSVSAANGAFKNKTMGSNLDETFAIIKAAMESARQNGEDTIKLEVNRLIKGFYKM